MEVKSGYKQTEVGVIPEDWNLTPLGRLIISVEYGSSAKSKPEGTIPVLRMGNLYQGKIVWDDLVFTDNLAEIKKYALKSGDVLFNRTNTIDLVGKTSLYNGERPAIFAGYLIRINVSPLLDSGYLNYILNTEASRKHSAKILSIAVGQANINGQKLKTYPIPRPPTKAEQEAIAEALSDADALIESLEQLLAKKRHLKQGAMQQLLTGHKRLSGYKSKWRTRLLGEVITGCSSGATPYRGQPEYYKGSVKWITSGELNFNRITETIEHISEEAVRQTNLTLHPAGTFLVAITGLEAAGTRGACGVVGSSATTNQSCMAIFPTAELNTEFLYHYYVFRGDALALQYCQGTKQQSYTAKLIKILPIDLPPTVEEQTAIAAILSDIDAEIATLEVRLTKARQLKQGMMQELLTGRIRLVPATTNVVPFPAPPKPAAAPVAAPKHNRQIEEAAVFGVLAKTFGTEAWPLPRKRRIKLIYLLDRYTHRSTADYLKQPAGPYDPATRYKGGETIAQKNRYVRIHHNGKYEGFIVGDNIAQAEKYFNDWYGANTLSWVEQFRFHKTDELELLATVDKAMDELHSAKKPVTVATVKQLIHDAPEWTPKLLREIFSDANLARAIKTCESLFA